MICLSKMIDRLMSALLVFILIANSVSAAVPAATPISGLGPLPSSLFCAQALQSKNAQFRFGAFGKSVAWMIAAKTSATVRRWLAGHKGAADAAASVGLGLLGFPVAMAIQDPGSRSNSDEGLGPVLVPGLFRDISINHDFGWTIAHRYGRYHLGDIEVETDFTDPFGHTGQITMSYEFSSDTLYLLNFDVPPEMRRVPNNQNMTNPGTPAGAYFALLQIKILAAIAENRNEAFRPQMIQVFNISDPETETRLNAHRRDPASNSIEATWPARIIQAITTQSELKVDGPPTFRDQIHINLNQSVKFESANDRDAWESNLRHGMTVRRGAAIGFEDDLIDELLPDTFDNSSPSPDSAGRPEVGDIFTPHGMKIDGTKNTGRRGAENREKIINDRKYDPALQHLHAEILAAAGISGRSGPKAGVGKGTLLELVFATVHANVRADEEFWDAWVVERKKHNRALEVLAGEAILHGGECRHMGDISAALLEWLIDEGHLGGQVYYVRGRGHGWAVYRSRRNQYFIFDASQQGRLLDQDDPSAMYFNGHRLAAYKEAFPADKVPALPASISAEATMVHGYPILNLLNPVPETPDAKSIWLHSGEETRAIRIAASAGKLKGRVPPVVDTLTPDSPVAEFGLEIGHALNRLQQSLPRAVPPRSGKRLAPSA